jgi:MoaA/NifB/PqqE/SkfB family radical SAM enzyme
MKTATQTSAGNGTMKMDCACSSFPKNTTAIAIMVTRRCNMTCAHCSVESAPRVEGREPSEAELMQLLRDAADAGVCVVQFTGGEPMLRPKLLLKLVREAKRLGLSSAMATNGYWGRKPNLARSYLRELVANRMEFLTISYDRYHADFMGPEPILNIAEAAKEIGFNINVNVTRVADDPELGRYTELFGNLPYVRMRFYDVQPLGRARDLTSALRSEVEGFCSAVAQAAISEDGRVLACNGPAYFQPDSSPLVLGKLSQASLHDLLKKHWEDPVLATIRSFGPARLREELRSMPGFDGFLRDEYSGQCDLCLHITSSPQSVDALREKLGQSQYVAERAAKESIMQATRGSLLSRDYVNGAGACEVMLSAALGNGWPEQTSRILGRADLDWNHLLEYVCACGLAGALVMPCKEPEFARWAPSFVGERLQQRATMDALRELAQRQAMEVIGAALAEIGAQGILLKGMALRALDLAEGNAAHSRIPGDMDILVRDAAAAGRLRRMLIDRGFSGDPEARRTGPHHLAPVMFRGVPLEIHTDVLPSFWGYPDADALQNLVPVSDKYPIFAPSREAMLLHEAMHNTTHMFSHGLKLAFDVSRIVRLGAVDWSRLAELARATRCPRAFWAPLRVVARTLNLQGIPAEFLHAAVNDGRQRRIELVASKRLFSETGTTDTMNPFSRNAVFLLLFDGVVQRARYLANLTTGSAAESRRTALSSGAGQGLSQLPSHLRMALRDWRNYRRATRSL